ncbi:MAG: DNA repair exonuclease [Ruminococcaceae bacterium]|nr:DNA repair exonuclease [Oscillospiraceae bacterium]
MINFLHAADLHLDSPFAGLSPQQASQQRQEQRRLLGMIASLCKEENCQLLLLSGDLFDGQRVYRETLDVMRDTLSDCGAQVFIAPGNHDHLCPTSPYLTQAWPENVHIFLSPEPEGILIKELGCVVYGGAFTTPTMGPMLRKFRVPSENTDYVNLMVLHGDAVLSTSPYNPITKEEIAQSGLDYLALGHIHQTSTFATSGQTMYAWPGCPMGRGFDETGERGVFIGTAERGTVSCRFHSLALRQYESITVEAGNDPLASILAVLPEDTQSHIYRITLTGEIEAVLIPALYDALSSRFYALQIRDHTVPPLDLWTRCGEDTLEGMSLHTLHMALERCETAAQRRCVELAARRIAEIFEGREVPTL